MRSTKRNRKETGSEQQRLEPAATVLVVDDDDDLRFLLLEILRRAGYRAIEAASGEQAERLAVAEGPDLILMDIGMPELDGLSALWQIREHAEIANVPVVIISAYDSLDLRAEAAAEGCRGYLTKPVDPEELTSLIDEILRP